MKNLKINIQSTRNILKWFVLLGILILPACQPTQPGEIQEHDDAEPTASLSIEEENKHEITPTDVLQPDSSNFLAPPPRLGHNMVYDAQRQKIVLFGGSQAISKEEGLFNRLDDTWEYDGTTWTQIETKHAPESTYVSTMIYHDAEEKVIAFGGPNEFPDPWQYDSQDWQQIDAEVPLMPESAVYYPKTGDVIAPYQCWQKCDTNFYMTWHFDGKMWYEGDEIFPYGETGQDPFFVPQIVYDSHRDVVVFQIQWPWTFEFDGLTWTLIHGKDDVEGNLPPLSPSFNMVYDSHREVVVLYGKVSGESIYRTWEYDGENWQEIVLEINPPPRLWSAMAFDEARGVTVLFGGEWEDRELNDTWEYDGTTWVQR
ncbi:MAG: hypothetical protein GY943_19340 [Chloroflexi bacterium]|nr:hypothetical protein [Chloroflexota bacterium]